jgi:hypothetical protein
VLEKRIIYNDQPPKLISSEIKETGNNLFEIIIKAQDATELNRMAEAEISCNGGYTTEILPYNSSSGLYEITFMSDNKAKPRIKSITLEDELNNKKTYLFPDKN